MQNRLFLGQAQLAMGDRAAARATLTADHDAAMAQYGPNNPWTLRTQLALARLAVDEDHPSEAQAQLNAIIPGLRANGVQNAEDLAEAVALLGQSTQLPK